MGVSGVVLKAVRRRRTRTRIAKISWFDKEETGDPKEVSLEGGHSFVRSSKRMREVESQAQLVLAPISRC